ncbi:C6 zinc finger protein [Colletotrichum acutatum]
MLDLELIHHWTLYTYDSLTVSPVIRTFWLRNAAQIGFRCDFVMRSLLALSAVHLATLNPAREEALFRHALKHHNTSTAATIASIHHIDQVEDIAMRENLFLYSMFIMFYIISQTEHPQDAFFGRPSRKETSSPDWMVFFHGSRSIALASMALHTTTSLTHPVIGYTMGMLADRERTSKKQYLSTLLARIKEVDSNEHYETYLHAAEELEATFAVLAEFPESRDIFHGFLWISNVSDHRGDLIALIQGRHASQEALVVYTYFCKMIQRLPARWWSEKWVRGLKDGALASLDEEHRAWVVELPSWT